MVSGAILAGAREALDPEAEKQEPEVQYVRPDAIREIDGVTLYFVPDSPQTTRAVVRPAFQARLGSPSVARPMRATSSARRSS